MGEKEEPQLSQPLFPPPPSTPPPPHYAYPAAAYPPPPPPAPQPPYVLVPVYPVLRLRRLRLRRNPCRCCCLATTLLLLAAAAVTAFLLYPAGPAVRVADLRLDRLRVAPPPLASVDLELRLRLRLRNPSFLLPLSYHSVVSSISYRGRRLGSAAASGGGGELKARGVAYTYAEVWVDGARVLDEALELIGDLAAGSVPLETVTEVDGAIRVFSLRIPVKGRIACSLNVSPETQRIISQDCYAE